MAPVIHHDERATAATNAKSTATGSDQVQMYAKPPNDTTAPTVINTNGRPLRRDTRATVPAMSPAPTRSGEGGECRQPVVRGRRASGILGRVQVMFGDTTALPRRMVHSNGGGVRRWRGAVRDARSGVVVHQTRSPVLIDVEQTLEMPPQNLEQLTRVYGPTT